jgi:hypothetical protein
LPEQVLRQSSVVILSSENVKPARIRVGFPSTLHPLAVHPDGSGAAAGEVVAAAEDEEEEEAEMVVEADAADDDLDTDTDVELDEELAEAEGATAPAGPVKIVNREPPPQVCPAFPAQGVLH